MEFEPLSDEDLADPAVIDIWLESESARRRIRELALRTPLLPAPELSAVAGARIEFKLESLQVSGSFKLRGAANLVLGLPEERRRRGVIACSSGNHGLAVAHVARATGVSATICVPRWVDPAKLDAMRAAGADVDLAGDTYDEAAKRAEELQRERELEFVHPYDDPRVIAGQATIGLELLDAAPDLDAVVVPLSGGGLIAGIAAALKARRPGLRVVAAYAARARVMVESLRAGHLVEMPEEETLATALAGGLGEGNAHSLRLVRALVDEYVGVEEDAIARAMAFAYRSHNLVVEGGGAVGIGAVLERAGGADVPWQPGAHVAVVVSGGNIDPQRLAAVVE